MARTLGKTVPGVIVSEGMAVFAHHVVRGETPADAARFAGFERPEQSAALLLRHPLVRKALAEAAEASLECELQPLAMRVARDILLDDNPKAVAVRAKLALGIMDRVAKNRAGEPEDAKPLQNLSEAELERIAATQTRDVAPVVVRDTHAAVVKDVT